MLKYENQSEKLFHRAFKFLIDTLMFFLNEEMSMG